MPARILPQFDRSIAVRATLSASWTKAVEAVLGKRKQKGEQSACSLRNFLSHCDSNSYWEADGNVPLLIFNATSATDGGIVPLSNVDPQYFSALPLSGLNRDRRFVRQLPPFQLISGALASARFPLALPAAKYVDNQGRPHFIVDGGYFDNSGLVVAKSIRDRIETIIKNHNSRPQSVPINAQVYIIYLNESDLNLNKCNDLGRLPQSEHEAISTEWAHILALFRARDKRSILNEELIWQLLDSQFLIDFRWDLHNPPVLKAVEQPDCGRLRHDLPLAFYYSPTTRNAFQIFLEMSLLNENSEKLSELKLLLTAK